MKEKNSLKLMVLCILAGAFIGSLIGALGLSGVISGDKMMNVMSLTLKVCVSLIVLIIDLLFILGLCQPFLLKYIYNNGETTVGVIEYVREIPRPDQLFVDEWIIKVRYSCTIRYKANNKEYSKEFPPTHLTSKREMYPLTLDKNNEIPIRYLKRLPTLSAIDVDKIRTGRQNEAKNDKIYLIMIPSILTAVYITTIIMI
ncbi:MAG: hypothetical protein K6G33_00265 [Ruminococcus sp.]|uniref:hypothetical protein n=1 Tax=Ruminococcus sp. TaxID=41978 RepID=UPI0026008A99|nr:hypothetical protein [Ruminococcus sp.]MCR5599166.1 hypothetical protein [Ruminococcus sp.]